jgi:ribosomal protein S18 acetylase RimI-like enzyme
MSLATVIVRAGTPADRPRVQDIAGAAMRAFQIEPDFDDLDRDLGRFGEQEDSDSIFLAAEWRDCVVGSLVLTRKDGQVWKLSGFYVDQDCRGQGVGRALLQAAIAAATARGASGIYLETWSKMAAAVSLYTSFGWRRGEQPLPESTGAEWSYMLDL